MAHYWPPLWGSGIWRFIHVSSFAYPFHPTDTQKLAITQFFDSLQHLLPCSICQYHWKKYLSEHPVDTENRLALVEYCRLAHNYVSRMLGKPEWSAQQLFEFYGEELWNSDRSKELRIEQESKKAAGRLINDAVREREQVKLVNDTLQTKVEQSLRKVSERNTELILAIVLAVLVVIMIPVIVKVSRNAERRKWINKNDMP